MGWWTNAANRYKGLPKDAVWGAGAGDQILLVIPSLKLIMVRNGEVLFTPAEIKQLKPKDVFEEFHDPRAHLLFEPLAGAVTDTRVKSGAAPVPPSQVITGLQWAPKETIVRRAHDSDNWPLTWGDDDAQYTSYGDGFGFEPRVEKKLGMGFARITGGPEDFRGVNLRSDGERTGGGAASAKASGILMVDGVRDLWVRNVGNSQLWWSADRGKTWREGFKLESGFGSPAFLNFGKNYAGARDEFVYAYSQDGPSAYESDNAVALARAPKARLRDRASWTFFAGLDGAGRPVWTGDIAKRRPVFEYPANCQRVDVVYDAGIRRYLMALGYDHAGGWGLFDAPEPWGPWTTVLHRQWDVAGTHGYRLPARWLSQDGLELTLVFSGVKPNDAFCARRLTLRK
jgi:hypothetical protein